MYTPLTVDGLAPYWEVSVLVLVSWLVKVAGDANVSGEFKVPFKCWFAFSCIMFGVSAIMLVHRVVRSSKRQVASDEHAERCVALNMVIAANCVAWFFIFEALLKLYYYYDWHIPNELIFDTAGTNSYLSSALGQPMSWLCGLFPGNVVAMVAAWIYYRKPVVSEPSSFE